MPLSIPPIQWPKIYNMVNLGGIDLATANGSEVPGIYQKITDALTSDHIEVFYNWKFADIVLPPSKVVIDVSVANQYTINEEILIKSDDTVGIIGFIRIPVILPLTAEENAVYNIPTGADGFGPVTVQVPLPTPTLVSLNVDENGTYTPEAGVDGFNEVVVDVSTPAPTLVSLNVDENGTYTPEVGVDGFNEVVVNVPLDYPTLPSTYQEVEYLECYGAQYVQQNGIYLYNGDILSSAVSLDASVSDETEDGVMGGGKSSTYEIYFYQDILQFYGRITGTTINIERDTKYPFTGTINSNTSGTCEDFALGRYSSSYVHVGKIWRTTIQRNIFRSDNNHITPNFPPVVFRDFVPCYRKSDNKPGFFELFSSTFLTNLGSGEFGLGPEI